MRTFNSEDGHTWQAALGHESHGAMCIIFSCLGNFEVFKGRLDANSRLDGESELGALSDTELSIRLKAAERWP